MRQGERDRQVLSGEWAGVGSRPGRRLGRALSRGALTGAAAAAGRLAPLP